jgi:PAS domain-containing protein
MRGSKGVAMSEEDDRQHEHGAADAHAGRVFDPSLSGAEGPHVALQGKGSWARLLILLEVSPDALVMADAAGLIVSVNGQAQALFGYPYADLEGQPLEMLLPERFRAAHVLHRERYAAAPHTRPMGAGLEL